jgi:transglutaminase-like putative cysteine protease
MEYMKKLFAFLGIILLIGVSLTPRISSGFQKEGHIFTSNYPQQELNLLYGEMILLIHAEENFSSFNLSYSLPPVYGSQAPIYIRIVNDSNTTIEVKGYTISNDTNYPNKLITFELGTINKSENYFDYESIHLEYWVLVKSENYSDLPSYVKIPQEDELPDEAKTWLVSTKAIQSNNSLIKIKARQLKGFNNNLVRLANRIVRFTKNKGIIRGRIDYLLIKKFNLSYPPIYIRMNALLLELFRNRITFSYWAHFNDAICTLIFGIGSCTGKANLGAALFRANGVPAKDLIVLPTTDFWYDIHYISEYYCPGYGWVLAETTSGNHLQSSKYQMILRINYPEDENEAGTGFDYFGGCEQISWTDNEKIVSEPTHKGRNEQSLLAPSNQGNVSMDITKKVWEKYTIYVGIPLSQENQVRFNNATEAQINAIECFTQSNIIGYIVNMTIAYDEYCEIEL